MRFRGAVGLVILWLSVSPAALRDPFRPAADPCRPTLAEPFYAGALVGERGVTGFIRTRETGWRRVSAGAVIIDGWRVEQVTAQCLVLSGPARCPSWRWPRGIKGGVNGKDAVGCNSSPVVKPQRGGPAK
ncbi:HofP DNA utilization family protein [Entomohabitans teleogrylli]|uniref:HofP DNA utilization family protein n=1 Tax=Entomohabitans teleogrylli TaxID=1384589 RepID=UPI0008FCB233|nr:HofP DNA utilization family protein [Entomohabitans teleogrylli]